MKIYIQGKNSINLNQNNFIAKGGEGEIYGQGNTIFKIYIDPSKMIPNAKIKELQNINDNHVLKPKDIILNKHNDNIGFTMDWIKSTHPLCKLFTNSFRNKNNISSENINELIYNMQKIIYKIHENKCLIVDGNEFNYLVDDSFINPYFIDVDSYQTKSFPATAIMPSIIDYHTNKFSTLSDWFSFSIIACQLFIGIHPFKGNNPNYKKRDMEKRMKDNISIFNKETQLPPSVRDFNLIPKNWYNWFIDLFEKGKRSEPPISFNGTNKIEHKKLILKSTSDLSIELVMEFKNDILYSSNNIVKTKKNIFINGTIYDCDLKEEIIFLKKSLIPIFVKIKNNQLSIKYKNIDLPQIISCQDKIIINNNLFIKNEGNISHITFKEINEKILVGVDKTWNVMKNSSVVFGNIISHNILGQSYLFIPLNKKICVNVNIPELNNCKIVNMKYLSNVCVGIIFKNNEYFKFIIKFNNNHDKYIYHENNTDNQDVNFIVLPNGIFIMISEDGYLELAYNNILKNNIKKIENKNISTNMILCNDEMNVKFFQKNKLYSIKLK